MFKLKEFVVYPGHGVAIIDEVVEKIVGGMNTKFLKLTFVFKEMIIWVPVYNATAVGIRHPEEKRTFEKVIEVLHTKPEKKLENVDFTPSGWNRRHKEYQLRIQSGSLLEVAMIYRDLMYIAQYKDLSFGERTLLQSTEELLVQEIQIITDQPKDEVIQLVRCPFKTLVLQESTGSVEQYATMLGS